MRLNPRHAATPNWAQRERVVIFMGYGYRWLKPRDAMYVEDAMAAVACPIKRQLLGFTTQMSGLYHGNGLDIPLKQWLALKGGDRGLGWQLHNSQHERPDGRGTGHAPMSRLPGEVGHATFPRHPERLELPLLPFDVDAHLRGRDATLGIAPRDAGRCPPPPPPHPSAARRVERDPRPQRDTLSAGPRGECSNPNWPRAAPQSAEQEAAAFDATCARIGLPDAEMDPAECAEGETAGGGSAGRGAERARERGRGRASARETPAHQAAGPSASSRARPPPGPAPRLQVRREPADGRRGRAVRA
jgi:hypothetical protein